MRRLGATLMGAAFVATVAGATPAGATPAVLETQGFVVNMQCQSSDFALVSLSARSRGGQGQIRYRWDWTDNGTFDSAASINPDQNHLYADESTYTARVGSRDASGGVGADTVTFTTPSCP